jgi:hypothetical protein
MKKVIHNIYMLFINFSKSYSRKNLYNLMDEAIKKYCYGNQNIISIGAGGEVKRILLKNNLNFKEIDIDEKLKPDFVCDIIDMHVLKDSSVDVLFLMEVLQCVQNPFKAIEEIKRVLKPQAIIVGSTPFMLPIYDNKHDLYRYTKYGLSVIFKEFTTIKLVERNSYIKSIFVIFLRLINVGTRKQKIVGFLLLPVYLILVPFVWLLSPFVTNRQATTGYFFIFQKQ